MEKSRVNRILRQCKAANVDFFFKQWGGVHKSKKGRLLHSGTYDEMPERGDESRWRMEYVARLLKAGQ
jgi:protein gp37